MAKTPRHVVIANVECAGVSNSTCALVLFVVASIAACDDRESGAGSRPPDGGVTGGDDAGGNSSGVTIACNPSGGGCLCIVGDSQPGQLATCSPGSVAGNEMERGVCCVAQSLCTCLRYICRSDPGSSFCQCGSVLSLAAVSIGTGVADCPAPTPEQKCCFSQDNGSCICSRLACSGEEVEVPACSAAAAGACAAGASIPACR